MTAAVLPEIVSGLRQHFGGSFDIKKPDPNVHRDLECGWLFPYLVQFDAMTWGRWDYWRALAEQQLTPGEKALPTAPIPQIQFLGENGTEWTGHETVLSHASGWKRTRKMLEASLEAIAPSWAGWGSSEYINYFLDWLLFGFGYSNDLPREPSAGASDRLYQVFNIGALVLWPYDYLGDMFSEMNVGRAAGFYPTPHNIVSMMVKMTMGDSGPNGKDLRLATTMDPCIGTGRFGLFASNYTLCIAGQDINPLMVKSSIVNAFLYAPWMARPIPWVWDLAGSNDPRVIEPPGPAPGEDNAIVEPEPGPLVPGLSLSRRARRQLNAGQEVLL